MTCHEHTSFVRSVIKHQHRDIIELRRFTDKCVNIGFQCRQKFSRLDCGIAVPHGRTDAVNGIIGAVAVVDNSANENGTIADYETIDHSAIQIIVLTVAPETAQSPYLQLMAFVSRALRANNGYEKLAQCKTEDEMRRFFRDAK